MRILYVSRTEDNHEKTAGIVAGRMAHSYDFKHTRKDAIQAMNLFEYAGVVLFGSQINPGGEPYHKDSTDNTVDIIRHAKERGLSVLLLLENPDFRARALEAGANIILEMPAHPRDIIAALKRFERL
jgi:hypothetical protein